MMPADFESHRAFLKDTLRLQIDFRQTDQSRGVAPPPLLKPPRPDQQIIPLPAGEAFAPFAAGACSQPSPEERVTGISATILLS